MQNSVTLPDGYHELCRFDLQTDKKATVLIWIPTVVLAAMMVVPAALCVPIAPLFDAAVSRTLFFARILTLVVGTAAFFLFREVIRAFFLRRFGTIKPSYIFCGPAIYAGSNAYLCRKSYAIVTLAPTVFFTVVLTLGCCFVPAAWFWVVYIIQVFNLAGSCSDYYLLVKLSRLPSDILIQDTAKAVRVYSRTA